MSQDFSLTIPIDRVRTGDQHNLVADQQERERIASRLGVLSLTNLTAEVELQRERDTILARGVVRGDVEQACTASGEAVPARVEEQFAIEFRPPADHSPDEEIELDEDELDVIFHDGKSIGLGDAMVDTLALALDPFPRSERADEILKEAGVKSEEEAGAFGALASLKAKMGNRD